MFCVIFDFVMAAIIFLFGVWFYKSNGKAAKFLSGYNMKSVDERKKSSCPKEIGMRKSGLIRKTFLNSKKIRKKENSNDNS